MKRTVFTLPLLALVLALLPLFGGCGSKVVYPPVNDEGMAERHSGKFVWYDLFTSDMEKAAEFYTALFGWEVEPTVAGGDTMTILIKGHPVANIEKLADAKIDSQWLSSLSVDDVDAAIEVVTASGGGVYLAASELPDRGRYGIVIDPQGAPLALLTSSSGDPEDFIPEHGEWLGGELWTHDVDKATAFYQKLAPYDAESVDVHEKVEYRLLFVDDVARAGVVSIPWKHVSPQWIPYVAVDDIQRIVASAKELGGRILIAPDLSVKAGRVAIIKDPTGAVFGIQQVDEE